MLVEATLQPPLLRIAPDFERLLRRTCEEIISDARSGRASSSSGEWLLGNYSYLRTQIREVRESLPRGYYRCLPRRAGSGEPRLFEAARQLAEPPSDGLNYDALISFFEEWQRHTVLTLAELWAVRPMLKIALLRKFAASLSAGPLESSDTEAAVRSIITALRSMDDILWPEFVETLCVPDRILRSDPSGAYSAMDFDTRDRYRRAVEQIARRSPHAEYEIADLAIQLARESKCHVGYYLVAAGIPELRRAAHSRRSVTMLIRDFVSAAPTFFYIGGAAAGTVALLASIERLTDFPAWFIGLLAIPANHAALAVVNRLVGYFVKPRVQFRMNFRDGIPDDCRTIVVVPTLLLSKHGIQRLVENLEIYYLANRDRNLFFALLTDLPDADARVTATDSLIDRCVAGIRELNRRYSDAGVEPFFLFHRDRQWNEREGKWMGRERKRGKLDDFNLFVLGRENRFSLTVGDLDKLAGTRYVITLDSDTQLPRDTAWKLIGTMAHPLNRPVFDEKAGIIAEGHGLLQPRIGISMESAGKSRFASIHSGQTGFDPYTTAVSDVYQDLFGRATFTGKGIYDVAAFERATRDRFPDNALLSHDLIEGEHVRAGLVTDLEMVDDYPSRYQTFSKRKHRWVRGDWQAALWMLPRVPDAAWKRKSNPLPLVSRWKILDNLRRSLVEISYVFALLCAWTLLGTESIKATIVTAALLLAPAFSEIPISLFRLPPIRFLRPWVWTRFSDFSRAHLEALLILVFLPAQALLMGDAISRTLYRRLFSHRHLLEWESMAQVEMDSDPKWKWPDLASPVAWVRTFRSWSLPEHYLAAAVFLAVITWLALIARSGGSDPLAFAIVIAWIGSPALVFWLNAAADASAQNAAEKDFLRSVALSTWRYFVDCSSAEHHWFVPDNVQEDPPAVAHRASPTNMGLQLNAQTAAFELGYLTSAQFASRVEQIEATLSRMERSRGHFFNWYDTQTLQPLMPHFISTVDSGNLAASLIVTRQGCLSILDQPVIARKTLHGLRDYLQRLHDSIPFPARTTSIARAVESLNRQFDSDPDDLFFWEGVLTELRTLIQHLGEQVEWAAGRLEVRAPEPAREIRYWLKALLDGVGAALHDLCALAPWLCPPFEAELRMSLRSPHLAGLMEKLRRVPKLSQLGALYDEIQAAIDALNVTSGRIHESTLDALAQLRSALDGARDVWGRLERRLQAAADFAGSLQDAMDFRFLLDDRRKLLRIGWNAGTGKLDESSYDLLASEARTAVFLAIARGHAPREAWFQLGRKLTYYRGRRTLLSWSGTMFEYLMPALFMQTWAGTLLGESLRSVVRIQRLYAGERRIPWGISESAHAARDGALNYQYRAFGVPCCGMDRILPDDLVVAPYATVLSLMIEPRAAVENLRYMASRGWLSKYGFYEAIDFRRSARGRKVELIRAYMAHHQGMSLLALANVLLGNPIQKLFHSDPAVLATELLLQERMPALVSAEAPEEPLAGLSDAKDLGSRALRAPEDLIVRP